MTDHKYQYKGRNIRISIVELVCKGFESCWSFTWEGDYYGGSLSVSPGVYDTSQVHQFLKQDVEFLIDDPKGYAEKAEAIEAAEVQKAAEQYVDRRRNDETYQDIVARAKAACRDDVEPFLEELWDYWAEG